MEEKDNKEMTSAVRDTIAYIIAEDIIDSINPHNTKQVCGSSQQRRASGDDPCARQCPEG